MKNIICLLFGHFMESPWNTSYYRTNLCLRCGYKNDKYKTEGYKRK